MWLKSRNENLSRAMPTVSEYAGSTSSEADDGAQQNVASVTFYLAVSLDAEEGVADPDSERFLADRSSKRRSDMVSSKASGSYS